jgi:hypothetical protein
MAGSRSARDVRCFQRVPLLGYYGLTSADEFVSEALYHYVVARNVGQEYTTAELDSFNAEGLEEFERGETINGEEALPTTAGI